MMDAGLMQFDPATGNHSSIAVKESNMAILKQKALQNSI